MENMNELYSDIILEHNQCQENKHPLEDANLSEHGHNPSCGDDITLQADIQFNSVLVYLIYDPGACKVGSRGGNHHAVHALFDPAFRAGLAKAHSLLV